MPEVLSSFRFLNSTYPRSKLCLGCATKASFSKISPVSFDRFLFHFEPEKLAGSKHQIRSVCTALKARRATYSCRWRKPPVYGNHLYLSPEGGTLCMIRCVALRAFHRTATKPVAYATGKGCAALRAISPSAPCCGMKVASTESF